MKLRFWLEQVATVPLEALPFTKLEMPQMTTDVIVGFNTLILPVLQNNNLCRGELSWGLTCGANLAVTSLLCSQV